MKLKVKCNVSKALHRYQKGFDALIVGPFPITAYDTCALLLGATPENFAGRDILDNVL